MNLCALELELDRGVWQFGGDIAQQSTRNQCSARGFNLSNDLNLGRYLMVED